MQTVKKWLNDFRYYPVGFSAFMWLLILATFVWAGHAFAGDVDILAGTERTLGATINNTGKKFIYMAEGIISLAAYIKTKNLLVLGGIVVVAVFLNIVMKVSGIQS